MATATVTYTIPSSANSIMCQSNNSPTTLPSFQRRSSIRRGTISSLSKDVRANDFVEIIKQQKAIQQKERDVDTSLLRRRHSMLNMSNKLPSKKPILPPRIRTMSISDLKATVSNAASNNTDNAAVAAPTTTHASTMDNITKVTSGKIRLDEKIKGKCKSPTLFSQEQQHPSSPTQQQQQHDTVTNHLRKCVACSESRKEINLASKGVAAAASAPPHVSSITSASFSSDNTVSSCSSLSSYKNDDFLNDSQRRSSIIQELNECMSSYSTQMSQMLNQKENNIQACKTLIAQQQELLNQLEDLDKELPLVKSPSPPSSSSSSMNKMPLLDSIFAMRPKTQIVIRQTADKNEANTIFSLQGVCKTTETTCYIPDEVKCFVFMFINNIKTNINYLRTTDKIYY